MENRLYYLVGDALSSALVSVICAIACALFFSSAWPMPVLMIVSMVVGMVLATVLDIACGLLYFFGAMEIMVPTMFAGMFAGMYGAMSGAGVDSNSDIQFTSLIINSAIIGLATSVVIRLYSNVISGKQQDL